MQQKDPPVTPLRDIIAEEVRLAVWRRDAGRCVSCGSKERLQFDHVIPVAFGGGGTVENLQLLCATCNGAKGASLA
jgi:5-methylcytosine-specific restriction endonuclease McrA